MSVNKVILIGTLGRDPELKYTTNGSAVCSFSIATSEKWTDKENNNHESVEWHRIVVWGKRAETCNQNLAKGSQVYVEGKIKTRSWEDKDGNKRSVTEIIVNEITFLKRGPELKQPSKNQENPLPYDDSTFAVDDIPF